MRLKFPQINNEADYNRHFRAEDWRHAAVTICARHKLSYRHPARVPHGENIIFAIDDRYIVKIFAPGARDGYRREVAALEFVQGKTGIAVPQTIQTGRLENLPYIVMTQLAGVSLRDVWLEVTEKNRIEVVVQLGNLLRELHSYAPPLHVAALNHDWHNFIAQQARTALERQRNAGASAEWLESLPEYLAKIPQLLPTDCAEVFLHGDVHPLNLLLKRTGDAWRLAGLFDFGDSLCGYHEYEFVAPGVLMLQGHRELQREMLLAYGYKASRLDRNLRARLMLLTILYECSNLRKYALRLAPEAVNHTLAELESAIWRFCD